MLIEVIAGSDDVKTIRDRQTQETRGLQQQVYFHLPDSHFPVQGKIRVKEPLNPGKYVMQPVFKIGKYGDLEINPFVEPEIKPAAPAQVKSA